MPGKDLKGCPKKLASLIKKGVYEPQESTLAGLEQLKKICKDVDIPITSSSTKVYNYKVCFSLCIVMQYNPFNNKPQMLKLLEELHSFVLQGNSECHVFQATPTCTGGKVFQNCHHQVRRTIPCSYSVYT